MITLAIKILVCIAAAWFIVFKVLGLRVIKSNEVAAVEKWWSPSGSLKDSIIALNGEAGYMPELLRGGIHFKSVLMYKIHKYPLITIPQGQIAYVFARDGIPLEPSQVLGKVVPDANNFQDVRGFLQNGGQRGPQRGILREGTYAINLAQFVVITSNAVRAIYSGSRAEQGELETMHQTLESRDAFKPIVIMGQDNTESDLMGIVTVHDGANLASDEIIAPDIGVDYQDPEKFVNGNGFKGKQIKVLTDGTYYINRLFATVELKPKTVVPIGNVGVVVSYYGEKGEDKTGVDYKHGELVGKGCKGVLADPLNPGKYAFNTDAGKVALVPTTNIILKWNSSESGEHGFDEHLTEVDIITKDAFEVSLPLSVVMHIDYKNAPLVIQRFGDINKLVNQTLDPMISAYFKNIAQTKTFIQLIQERADISAKATEAMKEKFANYNLELEEVLIGTPESDAANGQTDNILNQLRDRQIAEEKKTTYIAQQAAAEQEKSLREAQAVAEQQSKLTESKIQIDVQRNEGAADASKATEQANQIIALAKANAEKVRLEGEAEASRVKAIGIANAEAIDKQVQAYGGAGYRVVQESVNKLSEAVQNASVSIVPDTIVNMGGEGNSDTTSVIEKLLKLITAEKLGVTLNKADESSNKADESSNKLTEANDKKSTTKRTKNNGSRNKSVSDKAEVDPMNNTEDAQVESK